jgi:hypothetical protein
MKYARMLVAVVSLFVAVGLIGTALADDDLHHKVTLYTPSLRGANIECNAINVSGKVLDITITPIGADGVPLSTTDPTEFTALPGTFISTTHHEADPTNFLDAYCKFEVSGGDRDDVRVDLTVSFKKPNIPGTTIPVWVFRQIEGH